MGLVTKILFIILGLLFLLLIVYFFLVFKLRNINNKFFRYKEENDLKNDNVLVVYQPSKHKTTLKIANLICSVINEKGYGYVKHTLSRDDDKYKEYKYVIFVLPVYFGEVHNEIINKIGKHKFNKLIIVYNGLNKDSNNEDKNVKSHSLSKYSKIKLNTENIDDIKTFIEREVL